MKATLRAAVGGLMILVPAAAPAAVHGPEQATIGTKHTLACSIDSRKELLVGTASPPPVAKGTVVHFTTVLESDGSAYSSSAAAPRQIPVHVYTGMDNVPSQFRPGAHCSAYWVSPLTVKGN